jgi:hypothetical protein
MICERLVDIDEGIQEWRYRHVKMVERTIGRKAGVPKANRQYLCHYCPVGSGYVAHKERTAMGMYD